MSEGKGADLGRALGVAVSAREITRQKQASERLEQARQAAEAVKLSSFCTVFAKTEILAHLRQAERKKRA